MYVTINNKENTANILLLIVFPYTRSHFIVFHLTMNSLPIIVFYFRWRMLEDWGLGVLEICHVLADSILFKP